MNILLRLPHAHTSDSLLNDIHCFLLHVFFAKYRYSSIIRIDVLSVVGSFYSTVFSQQSIHEILSNKHIVEIPDELRVFGHEYQHGI
jgi:hypothetical protein